MSLCLVFKYLMAAVAVLLGSFILLVVFRVYKRRPGNAQRSKPRSRQSTGQDMPPAPGLRPKPPESGAFRAGNDQLYPHGESVDISEFARQGGMQLVDSPSTGSHCRSDHGHSHSDNYSHSHSDVGSSDSGRLSCD